MTYRPCPVRVSADTATSAQGRLSTYTATPKNDDVEAGLIARRFAPGTPAGATKGMTGHTLGAAGALGAVFSLLALEHGILPGTVSTSSVEPGMRAQPRIDPVRARVRHAMSHAFAFGGSHCVRVLGHPAHHGAVCT